MTELVVIVGSIASGKSTVASALGARFRAAGRDAAVLDLDGVVDMIGGFRDLRTERFRQAQVVFGELVGAWLRQEVDVVAHGPFLRREEDNALLHAVPNGVMPTRVHLWATYEAALERVAGDPARGLSKDPELLRLAYQRVELIRPTMPPSDWTFDTTTTSWQDIVDELAAALLPGR